jgi:hypothetical protein
MDRGEIIAGAIRRRRIVIFRYLGKIKIVEPYRYGLTLQGLHGLKGYQINGPLPGGHHEGWQIYHIDAIESVRETEGSYEGMRHGYMKPDPLFAEVYCEV